MSRRRYTAFYWPAAALSVWKRLSGVRRYLESRGAGVTTPYGKVPIVPAAILYDLGIGKAACAAEPVDG
jgi:L-aminopeptidase/D-esterase-like protein